METQASLLAWINKHDCGISPCGVPNEDGSITIRYVNYDLKSQKLMAEETVVHNHQEARNALGY